MSESTKMNWLSKDFIQYDKGILIACDQTLEWLLPWWWSHYQTNNHLPVAFVDFGMSAAAREWCKDKGIYIPFIEPLDFLVSPDKINRILREKWKSLFLNKEFWKIRALCLKKPFAMIKSPFLKTVWTDVDCEIKGSLDALFETCQNGSGFAIAPQPEFALKNYIQEGLLRPGQKIYNAGVVVYPYQSPLVSTWAQAIIERNAYFSGDSDLLADIIQSENFPIYELPQIYNWRMAQGENPEAVIIHWVADWGKKHIKENMKNLSLETF
ncbi:hypothetical protein [Candidatus Protochlamydia amoebophila]|uniref:Nucleotide-diphospho-sugar transferase domain-containing protein n=1 Tax=Protochlamydia amoebophila (strain UWE25) TaxID=264201 RepID=Q6MA91_PARUW|nr:hypothetical protein [Candidatus Protochlamydia amoebophila]CAF24508.1 unnamed protein product [Candidatus Protochlamydia amoebophila UWE25]